MQMVVSTGTLFFSLVLMEVQRASEGRQGEDEEEEAWRRFLEQQATNCVTLQLLSVSHQAPVKVDLGNHTHNSKGRSVCVTQMKFFLLRLNKIHLLLWRRYYQTSITHLWLCLK